MVLLKNKNNKKIILALVLIGLSLFSLRSLMQSGYFLTHDGSHLLVRLGASFQALRSGQIPLRWSGVLNHNYGYPVFNFLYPLYLYFGAVLNLLGFGLVSSFKLIFISAFTFSALAIFLYLSSFFSLRSAFFGSIAYLFSCYRFTQIMVRGSVGEVLAMAIAPFVFYFFHKIKANKIDINFLGATLSLFLLVLSHNTLALLFLLVLGGFLLIKISQQKKLIFYYLNSIFLGLGLSSFFWLPAIWERKYTYSSLIPASDFDKHFLKLTDLFSETWSFGFSDPSGSNQMSYSLGLFLLPFLAFAIFLLIKKFKKSKEKANNQDLSFFYFSALFFISCFLMLNNSLSIFLWNLIGIKNLVQFPWRLLSLTIFASSFIVAWAYDNASHKLLKIFLTIVILLQIINVQKFAIPSKREYFEDDFYLTNDGTTTSNNEFLPIWVKEPMGNRSEELLQIYDESGNRVSYKYKVLKDESNKIIIDLQNEEKVKVVLNKLYFPGWKVNNQQLLITDNGLISFELEPAGLRNNTILELKLTNTPVRFAANMLSLLSVLYLIFLTLIKSLLGKKGKNESA